MPLNRNPWVEELLTWHGHSKGGVRVPFVQQGGNPLKSVIKTSLIERLRQLARNIATGEASTRWIFLVGGPGNGKSEAVQDFLTTLDSELECHGLLVSALQQKFTTTRLSQWKVAIEAQAVPNLPASFTQNVGSLIIVQDASASEEPGQDAGEVLADSILDLLTHPNPHAVFICCVNRGLLIRSLKKATQDKSKSIEYEEVVGLLKSLIRATSLGRETLVANEERPSCWPLDLSGYALREQLEGKIACWPLDMESLLLSPAYGGIDPSPVEQILEEASREDAWEVQGRCGDCDVAALCPFRQNSLWLRKKEIRNGLTQTLRREELAIGRRWNFRDTFSLVAELFIGEWEDFGDAIHPCDWVHRLAQECTQSQQVQEHPGKVITQAFPLLMHLYPHAMFRDSPTTQLSDESRKYAELHHFSKTLAINTCITMQDTTSRTHIRALLQEIFSSRIDPALFSPHDTSIISQLEDSYSQSVAMGNDTWLQEELRDGIESLFFDLARQAEEEWSNVSRESALAGIATRFLRILCSGLAKRSVGLRKGLHAGEPYLSEYEATIRDDEALIELTQALRSLLGENGFDCNALESFGQPQAENDWFVSLEGTTVSIDPITAAPTATAMLPAHDLPFIKIADHAIPLTFDLYMALRLRKDGCMSSSLPASVRAALDRIRHLQAGELCHKDLLFVQGQASYKVKGYGSIFLPRVNTTPKFREMRS